MGTTGAAMLLIRPLLRANDNRKHVVHVVVFFIFLVANAGGSLTPLGDPPLFLGFLKGVDFFWTAQTILPETLFIVGVLLALFYALDRHYFTRKEGALPGRSDARHAPASASTARSTSVLLGGVVALVLMSGFWKSPGVELRRVRHPGRPAGAGARCGAGGDRPLCRCALTHARRARAATSSSGSPMAEVAKLFAGIFLTIIPVIAMLKAGDAGPVRRHRLGR